MSGRGRGYGNSRGSSYRGSRGSWGGDSRSTRGGYGSTRGGGAPVGNRYWGNATGGTNSNFESHHSSRYGTSNSASRFSSTRGSGRDDNYKRTYRTEPSPYSSSRDMSGHRSPDRKRIRSEATNSRRSHGNSYGNYNTPSHSSSAHRYESGPPSTNRFSSEHRDGFGSSDRRPSSSFRPPRNDYHKSLSAPRGSFRGRAGTRGAMARRDSLLARRRFVESTFISRRRGVAIRSSDYLRKLRMQKIRSAAIRRMSVPKKFKSRVSNSDKDSDKEDSDSSDKKTEKKVSDEKSSVNGEDKKSVKDQDDSPSKEIKKDKEESDEGEPKSRYSERSFIQLPCPHCKTRCMTFKEYAGHLYSSKHSQAMRRVAVKQKALLSRLRIMQRQRQRELDKGNTNPFARTNFCLLCKLNYKQLKSVHQSSDLHKEMKRFLMPYCKMCRRGFLSPMLYENHICSLEHLKLRADLDPEGLKKEIEKEKEKEKDKKGDGNELFLENFLTIDSVGDVDDEEANDSDKHEPEDKNDKGGDSSAADEEKESTSGINVGLELIKKVEVPYCTLCKYFLTTQRGHALTNLGYERAVQLHCRSRQHLKRYVRKREDKTLLQKAEKIHRSNLAKMTESLNDSKTDDEKKTSEDVDKLETGNAKKEKSGKEEEDIVDDKLWADVDKDLGDLLREAEPGNKSSDEDEEKGEGERYDRFRYSEKGTKGIVSTDDTKVIDVDVVEPEIETSVKEDKVVKEDDK